MGAQDKHVSILLDLALFGAGIYVYNVINRRKRDYEREKYIQEEATIADDTMLSINSHFHEFELDENCTITEANQKRTIEYYQKTRYAHLNSLCPGVRSYPRLRNLREAELKRAMRYYREGTKSHRTVIVMCDDITSKMLDRARKEILKPLDFSSDTTTEGVWIPKLNLIPTKDLHITVAIPFWWHSTWKGDRELSEKVVRRFQNTLVLEHHHAFQVEVERILLLGGKNLVCLWRTIGERKTSDGFAIYDRHGAEIDPFVKLRRDIVRCFATSDTFSDPLTYNELKKTQAGTVHTPPRPVPLKRTTSIEKRTPGMSSRDGFIHTTLARLPLNCLSMNDVDLEPIHRLCREATATYCGHRMVIKNFRFLETTGAGGESNPCFEPLFDETIDAPTPVEVTRDKSTIDEINDLHTSKKIFDQEASLFERNSTIGALPSMDFRGTIDGLFGEYE